MCFKKFVLQWELRGKLYSYGKTLKEALHYVVLQQRTNCALWMMSLTRWSAWIWTCEGPIPQSCKSTQYGEHNLEGMTADTFVFREQIKLRKEILVCMSRPPLVTWSRRVRTDVLWESLNGQKRKSYQHDGYVQLLLIKYQVKNTYISNRIKRICFKEKWKLFEETILTNN